MPSQAPQTCPRKTPSPPRTGRPAREPRSSRHTSGPHRPTGTRVCDSTKPAGSEPAFSPDAGAPEPAGGTPKSPSSSDKKETGVLPPPRRSVTRSSPRETSLALRTGGKGTAPRFTCHPPPPRQLRMRFQRPTRPPRNTTPRLTAQSPDITGHRPRRGTGPLNPGALRSRRQTKGEAPSTPNPMETSDSSSSSPELSSPARAQNRDPHPDQAAQGRASEDEPTLDREL
jgi:hypothetical protein